MNKNKLIFPLIVVLLLAGVYLFASSEKHSSQKSSDAKPVAETELQEAEAALYDAEGNPVDFENFRGKIVFINNWASWCMPCVVEMPTIVELKEALPAEDVVFVMVSFDRDPQKGLNWMEKKGMDLPVYFPGRNFLEKFMTDGIPATFILDREGDLLHTQMGMADYSSQEMVTQMKEWINLKQ